MKYGLILLVFQASLFFALPQASAPGNSAAQSTSPSPRQDRHDGMTVSAEPYKESDRAKQKFGKANPVPAGILPVEVTLRNETQQPIRIGLNTIKLSVKLRNGTRQDVDSLSAQQVAVALAHPAGASTPHARRFPVGLPSSGDKKADKFLEILEPLSLDADVVPPMGQLHGFVFFDVNHDMSLADQASVYIPDVARVPSNEVLMFFEVPLGAEAR